MDLVFLILGIVIAVVSGIIIHASHVDDSIPMLLGFAFTLLAILFLFASTDIALKNNSYIVKALNGTLAYDTVSLNKNGQLLEIKIK